MQSKTGELLKFANYLADEAAIISRKYFRQNLAVKNKPGNYPVTIADQEIELHLRALIKENYPKHGIIGEEYANNAYESEYCWVIDPIDGTAAFAAGKPTFTTLTGLLFRGRPILSIISQPIINERFSGIIGEKAYLNQVENNKIKELQTSGQTDVAEVRLNATTPYMFITSDEQKKFDLVRRQVKLTSFGGDAYAFGLLAAGHIDVIMEADLQYYDVAALAPIVCASGGVISDWQGKPLTKDFNGQCLASASQMLHEKLLAIINN